MTEVLGIDTEHPNSFGVGGGSVMFSTEPGTEVRGRHSFSYTDRGDEVQEPTIMHDGIEFTLIERIRLERTGKTVTFVMELTGPDGSTASIGLT